MPEAGKTLQSQRDPVLVYGGKSADFDYFSSKEKINSFRSDQSHPAQEIIMINQGFQCSKKNTIIKPVIKNDQLSGPAAEST